MKAPDTQPRAVVLPRRFLADQWTKAGCLLACSLLSLASADAQITHWTNGEGGVFSSSANWGNGVPSDEATAIFDLAGENTYIVDFDADATSLKVEISQSSVVWNLGGNEYSILDGAAGALRIGRGTGAAHLELKGPGTLKATATTYVGDTEAGELLITGGAEFVQSGSLWIAVNSTGAGSSVSVKGEGTKLSVDVQTVIGRRQSGHMTVSDKAEFFGGGTLFVGGQYKGTLEIDNASVAVDNSVVVGRNDNTSNPTEGVLQIKNGGKLEMTRASSPLTVGHIRTPTGNHAVADGIVQISGSGSLLSHQSDVVIGDGASTTHPGTVYASGLIEVLNGGELRSATRVADLQNAFVGVNGGQGQVLISGENSQWNVSSTGQNPSLYIGGDAAAGSGRSGRVTVADQGTLNVDDLIKVWENGELALASGQITAGRVVMDEGSRFLLTLSVADLSGSRVLLTNDLTLDDATFSLTLADGFTADDGDRFSLVTANGFTGTFLDLMEGAIVSASGYDFRISYGMEEMGTLSLTVVAPIPEPGAVTLVLLAGGWLVFVHRKRLGRKAAAASV